MGQIAVLDQNMINIIAAGEVVERPASVVKELMENSIDAGATNIIVRIEDGGRKLISVTDNGCGMDAEDLARAFEPHTTSKVKTTADLHNIVTLGFRGEALASIAAIANVRAASKVRDSDRANCIEIDCGQKQNVAPCSGDYGTTIQVRDIFYKLPARRKFLRTANTEMEHIVEQFVRVAIPNTNLDMTLVHNDREIYQISNQQSLQQRIGALFPTLLYDGPDSLLEAQSNEKGMEINALLGKPSLSKTNNRFQYVFLNGRFIHDKFISHAIKEAYRGLLDTNRFPVVFLFIRMPHQDYDVNVHPTKIEVRFYNANLVHSQVLACLREKLLGTNLDTTARIPVQAIQTEDKEGIPAGHGSTELAGVRSQNITDAMSDFFRRHRPAQTYRLLDQMAVEQSGNASSDKDNRPESVSRCPTPVAPARNAKFIQIHDSFIIEQTEDGFVVIDQHALHERIVYEALRSRIFSSKLESQRLLLPESFELDDARASVIQDNADLLGKLGIEIVPFGPRIYAVQSFPRILAGVAPADFVQDLIDLLLDKAATLDSESMLDEVLHLAACKAAVKAGQKLSDTEIEQLLADKQIVDYTSHCPHGRPTTLKFSIAELEKQFKRT